MVSIYICIYRVISEGDEVRVLIIRGVEVMGADGLGGLVRAARPTGRAARLFGLFRKPRDGKWADAAKRKESQREAP